MLSPPPPPLPGPGGLDAYHHLMSPSLRRNLSNHEVAEYLSSRNGEHDTYFLYRGRIPSPRHWAIFLHRHPLLSSRVQQRGESFTYVHMPPPDLPSAKDFAAARSHFSQEDLVVEFHKRRYLANDRLAYLITGEQTYLLIVAACIVGVLEWGDELRREVQDESDEDELESVLESTVYPPERVERERVLPRHKVTLADAAAAVLRGAVGGQSLPEPRTRRTVYLNSRVTAALKARCRNNNVALPHVLVAACAVAHALRAADHREPILIYLTSNHTGTRQVSQISLPCLCPFPPETALWRRAKQAARLRRYNPLSEAQRARIRAAAADMAAMNNPGLGLGIVMPRRLPPQRASPDEEPLPPDETVLLSVTVDDNSNGFAVESGTRTGPALTVVVRETTALVFTDVPALFIDDVLALLN